MSDPLKGHRDQKKTGGLGVSPSAKFPVAWCSGNRVDLDMGRPALCELGESLFLQDSFLICKTGSIGILSVAGDTN